MTLLAVYGTLKRGHGNHRVINGAEYVGTTNIDGFKMYSMGGFPAINPSHDRPSEAGSSSRPSAIVAEVFKVDDKIMQNADWLEGYPDFYNRKLVDTEFGKAWIYFIERELSSLPVVEDGNWR